MGEIFICFFEHSSIYISVLLTMQNRIIFLETKNCFFTYLSFCLILTEKVLFLSNIFIFGNQNIKFYMCIFLFFILSNGLFMCFLFISLKTLHLYLMKSNCCICFYIPNYSVFSVFNCYWGLKSMVSLRLIYYRLLLYLTKPSQ